MKILFIIPEEYQGNRWGGVTTSIVQLSSSLAHLGHNVSVITPGSINTDIYQNGVHFIKITHPSSQSFIQKVIHRILQFMSSEFRDRIYWAESVSNYIKLYSKFDIIEAPEWGSSTLFFPFHKFPPVVIRLHRSWYQYVQDNQLPISFSLKAIDLLERWCIATASAVTSPTHFMLSRYPLIHWFLRVRHAPVSIIPYGINVKNIKKSIFNTQIKHQYILTVGRVEVGKGSLLLINAFISLNINYPKIQLVFIGEDTKMYIKGYMTSYIDYLRKQLSTRHMQHRVIFIPPKQQVKLLPYYQQCLFYVTPSVGHENMSLALLEAIAAGKAALGSKTGGTPEVIQDNITGLLFNSKSESDLAQKMRYFLDHPEFRIKCETQATKLSRRYDIVHITRQMTEFYIKVIHVSNQNPIASTANQ